MRGNTDAERWALARRREFDQRLAALVQAAIDEGDLRADLDPRLVTRLLFGMVNSVAEWYRPDGRTSGQDVADAVVAMAFQGLQGGLMDSYVGGRWVRPDDEGTPVLDATTGRAVAHVSAKPVADRRRARLRPCAGRGAARR